MDLDKNCYFWNQLYLYVGIVIFIRLTFQKVIDIHIATQLKPVLRENIMTHTFISKISDLLLLWNKETTSFM